VVEGLSPFGCRELSHQAHKLSLIKVATAISIELIPLLLYLFSKIFVERVSSAELPLRPPVDKLIERNQSTTVSIHLLKDRNRQRLLLLFALLPCARLAGTRCGFKGR
jgi:hypothetical protein